MPPLLIRFDVTNALSAEVSAGQRLYVSAWLFMPAHLPSRPTISAWLNGGTYDKRYFHAEIPGYPGYSMAEHLAARGHIVVLPDHLGIGDSSRAPRQMAVTRQVAAKANHDAMTQLFEHLREGTLHPSIPAIPQFVKLGGGHSMGGMQTITQQADHRTYDRIAVLGYTAVGVHLTLGGQLHSADPGPLDLSKPDYPVMDRGHLRSTFHWDDVPEAVLTADDALLVPVPYVLSTQAITTGIVSEDARNIDVPIYQCLGERDVSPDPWAEAAHFRACYDYTLHVLPKSGHCQNFASTRTEMWDRIYTWNESLNASNGTA
ncbi:MULTISPECIES: alpha/beta hydrolase [Pseudomonas]|uniref:alpha/beta hydrolase n=1 Tax=Pseudomonas nitroreducens TaxID=46680 RepID=UPI001E453B7C|nr:MULTISPECIES: alpha/beta hydrolase [Pseudomonas]MCE4071453.1 alpha/beta hydrolase [Pseudomonas nitritireducens]MCE4081229.1 alpha/beta hydrolase [Pseudomonas nitroreducens]